MIKIIKFTRKNHKLLNINKLVFYQHKNVYKYFIFLFTTEHLKTSKQATNSTIYL